MKPVHRQLLALLLAVVLGSALCLSLYVWDNKYTRPGAQPMDGLLTLTDEELEQTDLHFLIHGWAFYPGVLLTPEEWTAHGTEHYMIYTSIGEHTRFDQPDGVTPHGYGTYVLTLELPEDPAQYGLELPEIYSAYRLYLNGNLELQVGEPDLEHYQPRTQNRMVTFTGSGFTTILLAVRDDSHFYSGLVYPPALGTPLAVNLSRGLRLGLAVCVTLCGVLGAALAAYFGVRMRHKNALLFALLCLAGSLFTAYPILHSAAPNTLVCLGDLRGLCHGGAGGNAAKPALSDPTPSCPDGGNRGLAVLPDSPLLRTAVSIPDDPGDESILPADFLLQDWFRGESVGSGPPGGPAAGPPGCAAVFRRRLLCNASSLGQTAAGL